MDVVKIRVVVFDDGEEGQSQIDDLDTLLAILGYALVGGDDNVDGMES